MTPAATRSRTPSWCALLLTILLAVGGLLALPVRAAADGPTTFANSTSIAIPATGSAGQRGPANPYPSNISVSGMTGTVTKVTVTLHNLTHSIANDIDAMVVAPGGRSLIVLSDASDADTLTFVDNATLTFDDAAPGALPGAGVIASGSYQPTNRAVGGADSFPSPAPSPSDQTTLAGAFTGLASANGTWSLYAVDDSTGDIGSMAGGWSLTITTEIAAISTTTTVISSDAESSSGQLVTFTATVRTAANGPVTTGSVQFSNDGVALGAAVPVTGSGTASISTASLAEGTHEIRAVYTGTGFLTSNDAVTQRVDNLTVVTGNTFCNTGAITGPGFGADPGTPYPSRIFVTGLTGQVTKVTADLKGVNHSESQDLDILLSGPTPTRNLVLLSDVGGNGGSVSSADLVFDDTAGTTVPSPIVSGAFRPTDNDPADSPADRFPPSAPALSNATTLSTFNGASGNGTWSLWVVDDATGDSGSIDGGWCLTITSQSPTTTALTAAPNPSTYGQDVTFRATVRSGDSPVTGGSVQFRDGAAALGAPVPVSASGVATLTTSALTVGTHTVTATYGGTATLAESDDDVDQVVRRIATQTSLTSSLNPSAFTQTVTFTATVTAVGGAAVTGSVQFADNGSPLGSLVPVAADGTAALTTSTLAVGNHPITATFVQTASLASSNDDLDQVVRPAPSTTIVTSAPDPSTVDQPITFTASVTSSVPLPPGGTVQFRSGARLLGAAVPLAADGTASITNNSFGDGSWVISADYSGGDDVAGSSGSVTQVVTASDTLLTISAAPDPSAYGRDVVVTGTVRAPSGWAVTAGEIMFWVDGDPVDTLEMPIDELGRMTVTLSRLNPGTHTVLARYVGSSSWNDSEATYQLTVTGVASAGGPYSVAEGAALTLNGSGSSPGQLEWDVNGDGDFGDATGRDPVLSWADLTSLGIDDGPAASQIRVRATGGGQVVTSDPVALTVTNTAPASVLTGGLTATVGQPFTIKVGADDPSSADLAALFTYTVDWGDGSPVLTIDGPADPPVTHTYATTGSFDATFTATDKDGGTGPGTQVTVVSSSGSDDDSSDEDSSDEDSGSHPSDPDSDSLASTGSVIGIRAIVASLVLLGGGAALIGAGRRRSRRQD